jgi:hypothetical protein
LVPIGGVTIFAIQSVTTITLNQIAL